MHSVMFPFPCTGPCNFRFRSTYSVCVKTVLCANCSGKVVVPSVFKLIRKVCGVKKCYLRRDGSLVFSAICVLSFGPLSWSV